MLLSQRDDGTVMVGDKTVIEIFALAELQPAMHCFYRTGCGCLLTAIALARLDKLSERSRLSERLLDEREGFLEVLAIATGVSIPIAIAVMRGWDGDKLAYSDEEEQYRLASKARRQVYASDNK